MKKITNFIVEKRNFISVMFIIFTFICVILSNKVNINYDMFKYLPSSSNVRIGMEIMEDEFGKNKTSSFNIMFKGLKEAEKENIYNELTNIENVSSVDFEIDSDSYNKDDYTLYVINIDFEKDSKESTNIYKEIEEKYEKYSIETSGEVADQNQDVLPTWIMVVSIGICMIILMIMCKSYIEPILFLTAIGVAVILNNGTNIIFSSVSNITYSISAILQMALSMDYSIMLMNRYRQEKENDKDNVSAMKKALYKAFLSISSSSVTTIVGLLALVFMSFTIGRDLGFVLAKGVLLSLVSIFLFLPGLILLFDKLIEKTKKKSPEFNLEKLGKFSYKIRPISFVILILLFVISFILKGNLNILYTNKEEDKIADIFEENNPIAIVYNNDYEELITNYCKELEKNKNIDEVLCYGNTINEKLTYKELNKKLKDLGLDNNIDEELLKVLYYDYYNKNNDNKITFNEFVSFIKKEENNNKLKDKLNQNQASIDKLDNFITKEKINQKRTALELSKILGIDYGKIEQLLIYYNSININSTMTLNSFVDFVNKNILTNKTYANYLDDNSKESLKILEKYINKSDITKNMVSSDLANFFGIDEEIIKNLYLYYYSINGVDTKLTLNEFANFTISTILSNSDYSDMIDEESRSKLNILNIFSNKEIINKNMTISEISNLFQIDEEVVKQIFLLYCGSNDNGMELTLNEFINNIIYLKTNTNYLNDIDVSNIINLSNNSSIMNNPNLYTADEVANIFNTENKLIYKLYSLIAIINNNTSNWIMTPNNFINLIINNKDKLENMLDINSIQELILLQNIMNSTNNNQKYNYKELANFINISEFSLKNIYVLYSSINENLTLTPQTFVNFIIDNQDDSMLKDNLDSNILNNLKLVQIIIESSLNDISYRSIELSNLLGVSNENISLIYSLYDRNKNSIKVSLKELVKFIINDVSKNEKYATNFDNESINSLKVINDIMDGVEKNIKYTANEMYYSLSKLTNEIDINTTKLLYTYYGSKYNYQSSWTLTVEELIKYLNSNILNEEKFNDFINDDMRNSIKDYNKNIDIAKINLKSKDYSRIVLNTKLDQESKETFDFIKDLKNDLEKSNNEIYVIGNSPMAYEMSTTFNKELTFITILTMLFIFIVVAVTFKSISIPIILVLIIQTAVYITMGILSLFDGEVYFIALLIVQSILMGATIDYAILYTSYYKESRNTLDIKESVINAYNKSIHTILTSSSILIVVTLIVGNFATAIAAKICKTISEGTICSVILILSLLPPILSSCDKLIYRKKNK